MSSKQKVTKELISIVDRNQIIRQWLKAHFLINISALCREIDYDRGNFWGFEYGNRDLPEEVLARLENVIIEYGYKKTK